MLSPQNKFRRALNYILNMKNFDNIILSIIILSSVTLILENPLTDPESLLIKVIEVLDIVVTIIFVAECVTKIIVFGFILNGPKSYLRNGWNILDFFIVFISVSNFC